LTRRPRVHLALAALSVAALSLVAVLASIAGLVSPARLPPPPFVPAAQAALLVEALPPPAPAPAAKPPDPPPAERADAHFVRWHRAPLAGGLLTFPPTFESKDGRYDLIIHFNGNTDLVTESYGYAGVNAVVMILNLGVGSGVYEDRFEDPAAFRLILSRVQSVMEERGLRDAKLGRIALSGWSSGYGGVYKVLANEELFDKIDGIMLLDAVHCGFFPGSSTRLKPDQIEPLRRFARKAVEGRAMLSITHSEIVTYGYLNAHQTTDLVLDALGLTRAPSHEAQPMPVLKAMVGVMPRALMLPLEPLTEVHRGELHVRGYTGNGPITHMLHLVQMSTTALPDLVRYWKR
jgi:hypothetical protein